MDGEEAKRGRLSGTLHGETMSGTSRMHPSGMRLVPFRGDRTTGEERGAMVPSLPPPPHCHCFLKGSDDVKPCGEGR